MTDELSCGEGGGGAAELTLDPRAGFVKGETLDIDVAAFDAHHDGMCEVGGVVVEHLGHIGGLAIIHDHIDALAVLGVNLPGLAGLRSYHQLRCLLDLDAPGVGVSGLAFFINGRDVENVAEVIVFNLYALDISTDFLQELTVHIDAIGGRRLGSDVELDVVDQQHEAVVGLGVAVEGKVLGAGRQLGSVLRPGLVIDGEGGHSNLEGFAVLQECADVGHIDVLRGVEHLHRLVELHLRLVARSLGATVALGPEADGLCVAAEAG